MSTKELATSFMKSIHADTAVIDTYERHLAILVGLSCVLSFYSLCLSFTCACINERCVMEWGRW